MSVVQEFLDGGNMNDAVEYLKENVDLKKMVSEILDEPEDESYLVALVLSVKRPKSAGRKLTFKSGAIVESYHRLILLRDSQSEQVFYLLSRTSAESSNLLRYKSINVVGTFVAVVEPRLSGYIHGIPVVSTNTSLVILNMTLGSLKVSPILTDLSEQDTIKSFLFEGLDIKLNMAYAFKTCGSAQCDAQHGKALCPSLDISARKSYALVAYVTIPNSAVKMVEIQSRKLAELFISSEVLGEAQKIAIGPLRRSMKATLTHYKNAGVPWIVGGWHKKTFSAEGVATGTKVHVTYLQPQKILGGAPLLQLPAVRPPALNFQAHERVFNARQQEFLADPNMLVNEDAGVVEADEAVAGNEQ